MSTCFVLVRAIHMAACLLVFGVCVFDRFVVGSTMDELDAPAREMWPRSAGQLHLICLPTILLSGAAWFALVVIAMSDLPPREALRRPFILEVLNQTQFGTLWKVRGGLWLLAVISIAAEMKTRVPWRRGFAVGWVYSPTVSRSWWASTPTLQLAGAATREATFFRPSTPKPRRAMPALRAYLAMILSATMVASLAWSGHGSVGDWPSAHIAVDAIHLLASAGWPVGLLPMLIILLAMRRIASPEKWPAISTIVRRFSMMSLTCVALLILTGIINSWILVGSIPNLWQTVYGWVLLVKIALFVVMLAIGAINLLVLKPRFDHIEIKENAVFPESDARRLRRNVAMELALGTAVMIAVGLLGLLPPAFQGLK